MTNAEFPNDEWSSGSADFSPHEAARAVRSSILRRGDLPCSVAD